MKDQSIPTIIVILFIYCFINGFVFMKFWNWFVVSTFDIADITLTQAIGLSLFIYKKLRMVKEKKERYQLPKFDEEKFFKHIQELVDAAPGGVVQFVIDLFCGAGGTSEGIEKATYRGVKCSAIIAGINHDKKAIYSQAKNHPLAYYTDEDIRFANLKPIKKLVAKLRKLYPKCPIIIWASLECTNHSNAKGGLSRDPDSRTLPWELYRYIEQINPDGIWIENVKEFAEWGPMMERIILEKGERKISLKNPIPTHLEQEFYEDKMKNGFTGQ